MRILMLLTLFSLCSYASEQTETAKKKRHRSHESITISIDPATENRAAVHHVTVDRTDSPHESKGSDDTDNSKRCMSARAQMALISSGTALLGAAITAIVTLNTYQCDCTQ